MKYLEDLRCFIGAFFLIVGAILLAHGLIDPIYTENLNLNVWVGSSFLAFAILLLLSMLLNSRIQQIIDREAGG